MRTKVSVPGAGVTSAHTTRAVGGETFEGYRPGSSGYRRALGALFLAGMATFVIMYDTQALLPELSAQFGLSPGAATMSMSLTTATLAVTLLVAGGLSERFSRTALIRWSLVASTVLAAAAAIAPSWHALLGLRALAGVALAGLPVVATAYLREEIHYSAQALATGLYIGGTGLGGMAGRLITAPVADVAGWRWALGAAALFALLCTVAVALLLPASRNHRRAAHHAGVVVSLTRAALREPALVALYGLGACCVGAVVAVFNALGFRLTSAPFSLSLASISLLYLTYALGTVSSPVAGRLADRVGRRPVAPFGCLLAVSGVLLTLSSNLTLIVVGLSVLVSGFFVLHGLASGWVTARAFHAGISTSQAAAIYLCAYYTGSSVFGNLGTTVWSHQGWPGVVALAAALLLVAGGFLALLHRIPPIDQPRVAGPTLGK